jgi:hypothetical protein
MTITITSEGPQAPFTLSNGSERIYCAMCPFADWDEELAAKEDENTDFSAFREVVWVDGVGFVYKDEK